MKFSIYQINIVWFSINLNYSSTVFHGQDCFEPHPPSHKPSFSARTHIDPDAFINQENSLYSGSANNDCHVQVRTTYQGFPQQQIRIWTHPNHTEFSRCLISVSNWRHHCCFRQQHRKNILKSIKWIVWRKTSFGIFIIHFWVGDIPQ